MYDLWVSDFEEFLKFAEDVLIVVEMTHYRMHFHIMFSEKNPIKSFRTINQWRRNSMIKIYKGGPMKGLEYMFKEVDETREFLTEEQPAIIDKDILKYRRQKRRDANRATAKLLKCSDEKPIPEWMIHGI
jgi:hypothetical protein